MQYAVSFDGHAWNNIHFNNKRVVTLRITDQIVIVCGTVMFEGRCLLNCRNTMLDIVHCLVQSGTNCFFLRAKNSLPVGHMGQETCPGPVFED
jgi:hypothetical protein